ncbi:hypothetical protein ACLK19_00500 [Escherichia coli]
MSAREQPNLLLDDRSRARSAVTSGDATLVSTQPPAAKNDAIDGVDSAEDARGSPHARWWSPTGASPGRVRPMSC